MNIFYLTKNINEPRGGELVFSNLVNHIKTKNDILVFNYKKGDSQQFKTINVDCPKLPFDYGLFDHFFSQKAVKKIFEQIKIQKPDLIHINQITGLSLLNLKKTGIPIIYTIHHPFSVDFKISWKETKNVFEKLKALLKYGYLMFVQKKLVQGFDYITTVSNDSAKKISKDYKVNLDKITVIYNGIDFNKFTKTTEKQINTVLTSGSFTHPRRGFKYAFKVYEELDKLGINVFDIGRRTPEQENLLSKLRNVKSFSIVDQDELIRLYSNASLSISTSLYEGFGLSILESIACETPCIAFASGGAKEILEQIDSELLVAPKDTKLMVEKIVQLMNDPNISEKAREYRKIAEEKFNLNKSLEAYEKLYQKLTS